MSQETIFFRKTQIHRLEAKILQLLDTIDTNADLGFRLKLWWQVEELRFELENLCESDLTSHLLQPRKTGTR
jgi:hypothetical protein